MEVTVCVVRSDAGFLAHRTSVHYYLEGRNGDFAIQSPLVLGHESAGVIVSVGPGVTNLVPGQRVAIEAGIMCQNCNYCQSGRYNLCKSLRFASSAKTFPHLDGTLQDRMNHPAHVLHPLVVVDVYPRQDLSNSPASLPDNCSFEEAALAEPLSVLIHAGRRAGLRNGQRILVFGVGTIGILACALAKSYGASQVVAIDINQQRLDFAKANGFASQIHCLSITRQQKSSEEQLRTARENVAQALAAFQVPDGFDIVFECTGAESCIQMSIYVSSIGFDLIEIDAYPSCQIGCRYWWQGHACWDGYPKYHVTPFSSRVARSRHPGVLPLCQHLR